MYCIVTCKVEKIITVIKTMEIFILLQLLSHRFLTSDALQNHARKL